jgi:DNA-binding MarR family transcriptional regulator
MVTFSPEQQRIARSLLKKEKTIEELRDELGMPANRLNDELKNLIQLKLVERSEDNRYKLIDYVLRGVTMPKKEREGEYKVNIIIEGISPDEKALEKEMEILESKLKNEGFKLLKLEKSEISKEKDNYTAFLNVDLSVPDFSDLVYLIVQYGPSSVELLEPKEVKLDLSQAQGVLNEVASAVHYYVSLILQFKHKEMDKGKD